MEDLSLAFANRSISDACARLDTAVLRALHDATASVLAEREPARPASTLAVAS